MTSEAFQWDTTAKEVYSFLTRSWDVRAAKRFIVANPRPVRTVSVSQAAHLLGFHRHDPSKLVDLDQPIIIATTQWGHVVIDGYHRIAKAVSLKLETLPAVILDEDESESVFVQP